MKIQNIKFNEYSTEALEQLKKGAFLTVQDGEQLNTMTIGWGSISYIWNKPIFMVAVRYSRHTYNLLENAKEFTVSIPLKNDLKKELAFCGTKSGRDVNKIEHCNLSIADGQKVSTPIISDCELHYECKVVYQQAMEPSTLDKDIRKRSYSTNDYHVLYFGEIVDAYLLS
ncbi:MAG: flavin reductase family protein [Tissierellaceae bacterium]|nr:flavin reductase family protein [Tissierellaceae bacterium]